MYSVTTSVCQNSFICMSYLKWLQQERVFVCLLTGPSAQKSDSLSLSSDFRLIGFILSESLTTGDKAVFHHSGWHPWQKTPKRASSQWPQWKFQGGFHCLSLRFIPIRELITSKESLMDGPGSQASIHSATPRKTGSISVTQTTWTKAGVNVVPQRK